MPNGTHGDHPLLDLLAFGDHPFPPEVEKLVREVYALNPKLTEFFDMWAWKKGNRVEQGIADMREMLERYPKEGFGYLDELVKRQKNRMRRHYYKYLVETLRNPGEVRAYREPIDGPSLCAFIVVGLLMVVLLIILLWLWLGK